MILTAPRHLHPPIAIGAPPVEFTLTYTGYNRSDHALRTQQVIKTALADSHAQELVVA